MPCYGNADLLCLFDLLMEAAIAWNLVRQL
uniref:Uncharacterized protein n=1 Tax=Rhizophora mucronata TaxID=61149 RepID=A0A2P2PV02_RHIMU